MQHQLHIHCPANGTAAAAALVHCSSCSILAACSACTHLQQRPLQSACGCRADCSKLHPVPCRAVTDAKKGLLEKIEGILANIAAQRERADWHPLAQTLIDL